MRTLHIIDSLGLGGAQTVVKGIFEIQKNNKDIFLFALRKREITVVVNHQNVFLYPSSSKYSLKPIKIMRTLIEKEKINVIHCHLFRSEVFGWILKRYYFPKIILIFHEHGKIFRNHAIYNAFIKKSQHQVNLFIAVSKATKQMLIENTKISGNLIKVLYNFVDLRKFNRKNITLNIHEERQRLRIKKEDFIIGFIGRLTKVKGCKYLIKSSMHLPFSYKILIVGNGPEKKKLIKIAERLRVRDKIIFLGYKNKPENVYVLFDLLVMPSRSESFGLSILEAQAMNVPVIASNIRAVNELIQDRKNGLLFEAKNPADLAQKIRDIYNNKKLKKEIIKNGSKSVSKYSLQIYLKKLSAIYKEDCDEE